MAKTAVLNKDTKELIKICDTAAEKKEFEGKDVIFMVSKNFEPTPQFSTWDEMIGKAKPVETAEPAKPKSAPVALEGQYHLLKPLPPTAEDHPKMPIWHAIVVNNGGTVAEAKAACPTENPKRKTSGVYTFNSEFRFFLKAGYAAMGPIPEGFDYTQVKPEPRKAKAKKEDQPAENTTAQAAA